MSANTEESTHDLNAEERLICRNLVMGSFKQLMEELAEHENHRELFSPVILGVDTGMTDEVEEAVEQKIHDVAEEMNPPRKFVSQMEVEAETDMTTNPPRCRITYLLGDVNLNQEFGVDLGLEIGDKELEPTEEIDDDGIDV